MCWKLCQTSGKECHGVMSTKGFHQAWCPSQSLPYLPFSTGRDRECQIYMYVAEGSTFSINLLNWFRLSFSRSRLKCLRSSFFNHYIVELHDGIKGGRLGFRSCHFDTPGVSHTFAMSFCLLFCEFGAIISSPQNTVPWRGSGYTK